MQINNKYLSIIYTGKYKLPHKNCSCRRGFRFLTNYALSLTDRIKSRKICTIRIQLIDGNFVAERELREALEQLGQQKSIIISGRTTLNGPQFKILGAMLKEPLVNDETMSTLMCEVKRILNDSDHQDDPEPLTPNKLLLLSLPLDILKGHASDSTKHNA